MAAEAVAPPPSDAQIAEDIANGRVKTNRGGESVKDRNRKAREADRRQREREEPTPASPTDYYMRLRAGGYDDPEACAQVGEAYGVEAVHHEQLRAAYEARLDTLAAQLESQNGHKPERAPDVFDEFEISAREKIGVLEQRERDLVLAVVANKDADAEKELGAVRCELHDAQEAVRTAALARDEHVVQQRRQQAEIDRRHKEQAALSAQKLEPRLTAQEEALDRLALEYAQKLSDYCANWKQHRELLATAGVGTYKHGIPTAAVTGALL